MQVQTNAFVLLLDADFVPSGRPGELYAQMKRDRSLKRIRSRWEETKYLEVLIIPAFERLPVKGSSLNPQLDCENPSLDCWTYENLDIPYTKKRLVEMVDEGKVQSFYHTRVCHLS